jgi:hypothetical protein
MNAAQLLFAWCCKNVHIFELTTFKMTFRDRIVVREIGIRALVRMLFEHKENNLT